MSVQRLGFVRHSILQVCDRHLISVWTWINFDFQTVKYHTSFNTWLKYHFCIVWFSKLWPIFTLPLNTLSFLLLFLLCYFALFSLICCYLQICCIFSTRCNLFLQVENILLSFVSLSVLSTVLIKKTSVMSKYKVASLIENDD